MTEDTQLHHAAALGDHSQVIEILESGVDVNVRNKIESTPLHKNLECKPLLGIVNILIKAGADVNSRDFIKRTPLHWIAKKQRKKILVRLIESGAYVDAESSCGMTPLHCAAKWNLINNIKILVESGADINKQDLNGNTPSHYSHYPRNLMIFGADTTIRNKKGLTPFEVLNLNTASEVLNLNMVSKERSP